MDLETASHWAALVSAGMVVVTPVVGLVILVVHQRQKQKAGIKAVKTIKPLIDGSSELDQAISKHLREQREAGDISDMGKLLAQGGAMQAHLGHIAAMLTLHVQQSHGHDTCLPAWLIAANVDDHEEKESAEES